MTSEERSEPARKAAKSRWDKKKNLKECGQVTLLGLLRGPTSGATEGASPLGLALLIAGIVLLLVLLVGVVVWRTRGTKRDSSK